MLFLNFGHETVEIVGFGILGKRAVAESGQGKVRIAERKGHRRLLYVMATGLGADSRPHKRRQMGHDRTVPPRDGKDCA